MSHAISGYGTLLKRENYPGSGTFQVVAELTNIDPPELINAPIEVTHHQSGAMREFIPGVLKEIGEFKATVNWLATGTAEAPAYATQFYNDWNGNIKRGYQIDWPTAPAGGADATGTYAPPTWQFNAYVTKIKPLGQDASKPEALRFEMTMKPTDSFILV